MNDQRNTRESSPKWEDDYVPKGRMIELGELRLQYQTSGSLIRAMYVCQTPIMWITTQIWREIWFQSQIWPPQEVLEPTIFQEHVVWGN